MNSLDGFARELFGARRDSFERLLFALVFAAAGGWSCFATDSDALTLSGTSFLKDGRPWIPNGVVLVGLVAPQGHETGRFAIARGRFGQSELGAIRQYGADLIRFQVSQAGSDPQSAIYSAAYVDEVTQAVRMARADRFVVIVSLQSEPPSGVVDPNGLPSDSTLRAWAQLAPRFAKDTGVMFELFNEPSRMRGVPGRAPSPTWEDWRRTMQPVLDAVRHAGANNIVIVDGLEYARDLAGAPQLNDANSRVVYGVHPYPKPNYTGPADWDGAFGRFAESHPVIATEWNVVTPTRCTQEAPSIASDFLSYAKAHRIGVVGWAFDFPGTLMGAGGRPTTFENFGCANAGKTAGPGAALHAYFLQK